MMMYPDARTLLHGIIGHPVGHSLSPVFQNAAFSALGMNAVYLAFDVSPADLGDALRGVCALGIRGLSVTIPHKEAVIPFLDEVDGDAQSIGAVNTVLNRDGRLIGMNTDWQGAVQALESATSLAGKKVLVIGAGGAARAVCYGVTRKGAILHVANRTPEKARALAEAFGGTWSGLESLDRLNASILVNTTSVGMAPDVDCSPVPASVLEGVEVAMDIVYRPRETRLLREARAAGCRTVDGLAMLLHQGAAQFEIWTGRMAPVDIMEEALAKAISEKESA